LYSQPFFCNQGGKSERVFKDKGGKKWINDIDVALETTRKLKTNHFIPLKENDAPPLVSSRKVIACGVEFDGGNDVGYNRTITN
jgi:hypothetical protein